MLCPKASAVQVNPGTPGLQFVFLVPTLLSGTHYLEHRLCTARDRRDARRWSKPTQVWTIPPDKQWFVPPATAKGMRLGLKHN